MSNNTDLSRRAFIRRASIGVASTALVSSTMASSMPSMSAPAQTNQIKIDPDSFSQDTVQTDVLVIGSGIAGLFAAIKAHDAGAKVIMVSKGRLGSSGLTPFGKGVFAYDKKTAKMTPETFLAKVADSSIGTNNPVFTKQLLDHSLDRVKELTEWGFFDSPLCFESFSKPMNERKIPIIQRLMVTHLHKQENRVVGASGFSLDKNKIIHFAAKTVVLCSGSGAFKPNGFPICDLTHDGSIMAYNIGAKITGKEWNDGHPASAVNSGSSYDNWHGQVEEKPSTTSADIHHDLGVDLNYQAYINGPPVSMGPQPAQGDDSPAASGGPFVPEAFRRAGVREPQGPDARPERGPGGGPPQGLGQSIRQFFSFESAGGPMQGNISNEMKGPPNMQQNSVGGSTAGMAIHKSEGLVPIDETGLSTISGLWAAGDALGSHMSGGIYTQVGSSMAGSAVQGAIAGEAAAKASQNIVSLSINEQHLKDTAEQILAPLKRKKGYSPAWVTQTLQGVMIPNFVLYIKKERMMNAALAYVEELKEHHGPMLMASDRHHLRLAHETMNMLVSAEMKLKASLKRTESRCSHYRLDYPNIDSKDWQVWLNLYKDKNGEMQFEKQPFNTWPQIS